MPLILECIDPHGERAKAIRAFYAFACERLGVVGGPKVNFTPHLGTTSFGLYSPSDDIVTVAVEGRHISDILRTFAHELVHHVQLSTDNEMAVEELEYQANAVAGMLMRDYNKLHPEMFGLSDSVEAPGTLGDSQGALYPDTTRPSGPIEMGENVINSVGSAAYASLGVGPFGEPGIGFEVDIDNEDNDPDWHRQSDHKNSLHKKQRSNHYERQSSETNDRNADIQKWKDGEEDRHSHEYVRPLNELSNKTLASYKRKAKSHLKFRLRDYGNGRKEYYGIEFHHNPHLGPKREQGIKTAEAKLKARYAHLKEDGAVVNSAGSGAIAGIGIGPQGEPGVHPRKKKSPILAPMFRRKTFKQLKEELS